MAIDGQQAYRDEITVEPTPAHMLFTTSEIMGSPSFSMRADPYFLDLTLLEPYYEKPYVNARRIVTLDIIKNGLEALKVEYV